MTTTATKPDDADALVDTAATARLASLSVRAVQHRVKTDPAFPKPVRVGKRAVRFRLAEVRAWLASLPTAGGN